MGSTGLLEAASVSQRQASPNRVNAHQPRREPNPCPANWASDFALRTGSNIGDTTFLPSAKKTVFSPPGTYRHFSAPWHRVAETHEPCGFPGR